MKKRIGRSYQVVMTNESQVLKALRIKHKLSMREAGSRIGVSDSYISLIENGRTDPPTGNSLGKFLKVYGAISEKYFYELVREFKAEKKDTDVIMMLLQKLSAEDQRIVRTIVESLAARG